MTRSPSVVDGKLTRWRIRSAFLPGFRLTDRKGWFVYPPDGDTGLRACMRRPNPVVHVYWFPTWEKVWQELDREASLRQRDLERIKARAEVNA